MEQPLIQPSRIDIRGSGDVIGVPTTGRRGAHLPALADVNINVDMIVQTSPLGRRQAEILHVPRETCAPRARVWSR